MEAKGSVSTRHFPLETNHSSIHSMTKHATFRGIHEREHFRGVHAVHWTPAPGG